MSKNKKIKGATVINQTASEKGKTIIIRGYQPKVQSGKKPTASPPKGSSAITDKK